MRNKQRNNKPLILLGYRNKQIELYKTNIKPLGFLVAGLGVACLGVAVFPNGLGLLFYPLGFMLLGSVGIRFDYKKAVSNKIRLFKYKRGLF